VSLCVFQSNHYIEADDADITVVDASSDMLVIDITSSKEL
jgi:hypothetical protein